LVKWTRQFATDTIWEQLEDFKTQFPLVELANELSVSEGGGNVVDAFVGRQYSRRARKGATHVTTSSS
jgi:hypothetical protein